MPSDHDLITDIIEREGGAAATNDPDDGGGRTQYGIAEASNPEAWADGKVTEDEARAIYARKYIIAPGFNKVPDDALRTQLIDFGVNSGPALAITKLQVVVGSTPDGVLGPDTLAKLGGFEPRRVNNLVAVERIKMIARIVTKNPSQLKFLNGWINRATEFIR